MSASTTSKWEACGNLVRTARTASDLRGFLVAECPVNTGHSEQDATLIAAAPDMLEALRGLLDPAINEDGQWYAQARQAARDAIAKATGGAL